MIDEMDLAGIRFEYGRYLKRAKKNGYICPQCRNGSGEDGTGATVFEKDERLYCHRCGFSGDLIDCRIAETGEDFKAAVQSLAEILGVQLPPNGVADHKNQPADHVQKGGIIAETSKEPDADYAEYFKRCSERLNGSPAQTYLEQRGLNSETASRFGLGYDPEWQHPKAIAAGNNPPKSPRLIVPTGAGSYLARDIREGLDESARKYSKAKVGKANLLNIEIIKSGDKTPIFITEGELDALSIEQVGGRAIALGGVANVGKLVERLKGAGTADVPTLLLALDADEPGREATESMAQGLKELNVPFRVVDITLGKKDPNEALQFAPQKFSDAVTRVAALAGNQPDGVAGYISERMAGDIDAYKRGRGQNTGFPNLDAHMQGIFPGLYVLGATSSLGKTTFCLQLADQIAANGGHVIFFSLEQSRLELVSKSIARTAASKTENYENALTSLDIRGGNLPPDILEAAEAYKEAVGNRMNIVEANFEFTTDSIREYVSRYASRNQARPTVIIDYLQILQGKDTRKSVKEMTDSNVTELKRLSRSCAIPIFLISSVNRGSYLNPISFESFKESGGIEYTADVVWGLQLAAVSAERYQHEPDSVARRQQLEDARIASPRKIDLVCLKNRFGRTGYKAEFDYYPRCDYFIPAEARTKKIIRI